MESLHIVPITKVDHKLRLRVHSPSPCVEVILSTKFLWKSEQPTPLTWSAKPSSTKRLLTALQTTTIVEITGKGNDHMWRQETGMATNKQYYPMDVGTHKNGVNQWIKRKISCRRTTHIIGEQERGNRQRKPIQNKRLSRRLKAHVHIIDEMRSRRKDSFFTSQIYSGQAKSKIAERWKSRPTDKNKCGSDYNFERATSPWWRAEAKSWRSIAACAWRKISWSDTLRENFSRSFMVAGTGILRVMQKQRK